MRTLILSIVLIFGILPYAGTAIPGLQVTLNPQHQEITSDVTTIDYQVTIINLDNDLIDENGDPLSDVDKTITTLKMTSAQPGWNYEFIPDPTGLVLNDVAGQSRTVTLRVTIPSSPSVGIHAHQVTAEASYEMIPGIPDFLGFDSDYENFDTEIIESSPNTAIPEFPTITIPVISVLGIMFLMSKRKSRSQ